MIMWRMGSAGLRFINVSDPSDPDEVGFFDTPGYAESVTISGVHAYVADIDGGMSILRYTGAFLSTY
jgi:hypothetical protein